MTDLKFDREKYFELLDKKIQNIFSRIDNKVITYDILDTKKTIKYKDIILREKQYQMKIGKIWQEVLGNYDTFINLKNGHSSGLDIISYKKKIIIELKNRTNTDNSSSKKCVFDKLANFKKNNPEYKCIYANINADTKEKTMKGSIKKIIHNNEEIEHHIGYTFIQFMLGVNTEIILEFVKKTIDKYKLE